MNDTGSLEPLVLFFQHHDFHKFLESETSLGRILHSLAFLFNSKRGFCDSFLISLVVANLNERKGWFATKLSDDVVVQDFYDEFVSGRIDRKPTPAEHQAGDFFPEKKKIKSSHLLHIFGELSPNDNLLIS